MLSSACPLVSAEMALQETRLAQAVCATDGAGCKHAKTMFRTGFHSAGNGTCDNGRVNHHKSHDSVFGSGTNKPLAFAVKVCASPGKGNEIAHIAPVITALCSVVQLHPMRMDNVSN